MTGTVGDTGPRAAAVAAPVGLLHELFGRAVERHPGAVAVDLPPGAGRIGRTRRTYSELATDAAGIAAALGPLVRGECVVAILLARDTPDLYAAQLAVLQAGAAFVCLDHRVPDERLRFLLEDARACAVVTDRGGAARLDRAAPGVAPRIDVGGPGAGVAPDPPWLGPSSLAYLIYTSGTTGRPKGVMVEHRSIAQLAASDLLEFGLGPGDRVAQGSSPAYDSSVEETWLALAAGATVVPLDEETVRLGPDLVPWLAREGVTVLCPPPTLLRTMACEEPWRALPDLRLVYVGGEPLPQDLADRWARGRRLVNGYGPTECTVTVVRSDVCPGEPVSIGWPVPGSRALVVDERLDEVSDGRWGELCIAGASLARGYLDRPEQTAERFVDHPRFGRIYRTGDRVRRGAGGALFCDGRLDSQVKLRGHRVELEEIEARLAAHPDVREAGCRVQGGGLLVAFVVSPIAGVEPRFADLEDWLRARLPGHMVPTRFAAIDELPTTVGGKLDRNALPEIDAAVEAVAGREPASALERRVAAAFADALGIPAAPCDRDFFDLGGDSVRAALLVSQLRDDPTTAVVAVRDVYEVRTVEGLAGRLAGRGPAAVRRDVGPAARRPLAVTTVQTAWMLAELVAGAALAYLLAFIVLPEVLRHVQPIVLVLLAPAVLAILGLVVAPLALGLAVVTKRALIGRYSARREPVWGWWHLRSWIVQRVVRLVPWGMLQGTELQCIALRALGARIGARVHLHRGVDLRSGGWDLLELGDDVSVGHDAALGLFELDEGHVVVGPVRLGAGATLEVRAGAAGHTALGEGACLSALSSLSPGEEVPAGERWDGVPARPAGSAGAVRRPDVGGAALGWVAHAVLLIAARTSSRWAGGLPILIVTIGLLLGWGVDSAALRAWIAGPFATAGGLWVVLGLIVGSLPVGLVCQALALRLAPSVPAGAMRTRSAVHVLAMVRARLVEAAGLWLSGTLFWPAWLRLAGARIGARSEISTVVDVLPEHVTIGADSFFADGIYFGGPRVDRGTVTVGPVRLGAGTFLGNHVVIPQGTELPDGVFLGVCTVADGRSERPGSAWFGHPKFELPRREVVEIDRRLTFEPGALRYWNRVFWELLRCGIPVVPALAVLVWWVAVASAPVAGAARWFGWVPAVTLAVAAALALVVLASKWLLLGRVKPGQHALWSCWCSRWDFLYVVWGALARGVVGQLAGTLWLPCYLRAMGMRIGRRAVLGAGFAQVVDPDMLTIEDGATVDTMFQAHSFEDRVLKIDSVVIRAGATLRRASVVLYGAEVGAGAHVAAHSVVMKNERLRLGSSYEGAPTRPR